MQQISGSNTLVRLQEESLVPTIQAIWADALATATAWKAVITPLSQQPPADPTLPPKLGIEKRVEAALHTLLLLLAALAHSEDACHLTMKSFGPQAYQGQCLCAIGICVVTGSPHSYQQHMPETCQG